MNKGDQKNGTVVMNSDNAAWGPTHKGWTHFQCSCFCSAPQPQRVCRLRGLHVEDVMHFCLIAPYWPDLKRRQGPTRLSSPIWDAATYALAKILGLVVSHDAGQLVQHLNFRGEGAEDWVPELVTFYRLQPKRNAGGSQQDHMIAIMHAH